MDVKEQVKNSLSIVDVVGRYVSLKPAGKNFKGLCPFHTEKTPSFFVMPEKNSYTCFGCHQFGDIFSIVMEMENLNFFESLNFLIDNYNLNIIKKDFKGTSSINDYYAINKLAVEFYKKKLFNSDEGTKAIEYLKNRGINSNTIEEFSLGYALNKWDGLYNHLKNKKTDIKKSIDLGLLVKSDKGKIYDRFRGRVMFPIFSESGKVIAFGGRTMFDEPSKYLNSPDTPVYKKSEHLYGFANTKKFLREHKSGILVEGYFDLLSLFQGGVKNVVASLGTALTSQQIYLLMRFTDSIYVFYDNDKAGEKAAKKAVQMMIEQNLSPKIIRAKGVKDPDDFIRENGLKEVLKLIENAVDGFKYLLDTTMNENDINNSVSKRVAVTEIMEVIGKVNDPIIKDDYIKKISDSLNIEANLLYENNKLSFIANSGNIATNGRALLISPSERIVIESILSYPPIINDIKGLFNDDLKNILVGRNIIEAIFEHYDDDNEELNYDIIQKTITEPERILFRDIYFSIDNSNIVSKIVYERIENSIIKLQDKVNSVRIKEINKKIKLASKNNEIEKLNKLMEIKNKYIKQKYNTKKEG